MRTIIKIIAAIVFTLMVLEGISFLVLKKIYLNASATPVFNRELSGYTVFRNTPDFRYRTFKTDTGQADVRTDDYGFICNERPTIKKDTNTIRIFLMGGSAMMSAGQNDVGNCYSAIKNFPHDLYAWDISISGLLQTCLQQKFPRKKIQVINAASYSFQLHQSILLYLETVSRFKPDLVIDMDGFNDIESIYTGNTFQLTEMMLLNRYVQLATQKDNIIFKSKTAQLILYAIRRYSDNYSQSSCGFFVDTAIYNRAKYNSVKDYLQYSSTCFTEELRQYMNLLQGDGVKFIFVLQPMLVRGINKQLNTSESRMANEVDVINPRGAKKWKDNTNPKIDFSVLNGLGISMAGGQYLTQRYFFDDYLSDKLRQQVEAKGFIYTDINRDISRIDSSEQYYTDYCHLTQTGYKFVAKRMADLIIENKLLEN